MKTTEYTIRKQIQSGIKKNKIGTVMSVTDKGKTDFDWAGKFPLGEGLPTIKDSFKEHNIELTAHKKEIEVLKEDIITLKHIVYDLLEQQETDMKGEF